jgi:hypothetical protein
MNLGGKWSVGGWKALVSRSMGVVKQAEMEAQCESKPTGVEYLLYRERGFGQAHYIQRAAGVCGEVGQTENVVSNSTHEVGGGTCWGQWGGGLE